MINFRAYLKNLLILGLALTVVEACAGKSKKKRAVGAGPEEILTDENSSDAGSEGDELATEGPGGVDPVVAFEPDQGIKTGRQIYNTFLAVTGITPSQAVIDEFNVLESSLPMSNRMVTFDAGKQSAIVKLAVRVCDQAVTANAATFLPGINTAGPLDATAKTNLAMVLMEKFWGKDIDNGVDLTAAQAGLVKLQDDLIAGGATPINTIKGACTAVAAALPTILL